MTFSCIIPVYNTEKVYLDKCLDSILSQSFQDYEILLVDDGSNSTTAKLCDEYALRAEKIRVVHQKNMGLPGARNTGIENARGEWLVHIDSDDWIGAHLLQQIAAELPCEDTDVLFWGYRTSDGDSEKSFILKSQVLLETPFPLIRKNVLRSTLEGGNGFESVALNTTWGKAYRRYFVVQNKLYFDLNLRRAQDVIYNLYAFSKARKIKYVCSDEHYYRLDNESLSRGYNVLTKERLRKTALAATDFLSRNPEYDDIQGSIYAFCRKCFMIIINMDFLNSSNPNSWCSRRKEFIETLVLSPFKEAFDMRNLPKQFTLNNIEQWVIASRSLLLLTAFVRFRRFIGSKLLKRY